MKGSKILLLLVCCGFVSCTVTKPMTSDVTPAEELTGLPDLRFNLSLIC